MTSAVQLISVHSVHQVREKAVDRRLLRFGGIWRVEKPRNGVSVDARLQRPAALKGEHQKLHGQPMEGNQGRKGFHEVLVAHGSLAHAWTVAQARRCANRAKSLLIKDGDLSDTGAAIIFLSALWWVFAVIGNGGVA